MTRAERLDRLPRFDVVAPVAGLTFAPVIGAYLTAEQAADVALAAEARGVQGVQIVEVPS